MGSVHMIADPFTFTDWKDDQSRFDFGAHCGPFKTPSTWDTPLPDIPEKHAADLVIDDAPPLACISLDDIIPLDSNVASTILHDQNVWTRSRALIETEQPDLRIWEASSEQSSSSDEQTLRLPFSPLINHSRLLSTSNDDHVFALEYALDCLKLLGQGIPSRMFPKRPDDTFDVLRNGQFRVQGLQSSGLAHAIRRFRSMGDLTLQLKSSTISTRISNVIQPVEVIVENCVHVLLDADSMRINQSAATSLNTVASLDEIFAPTEVLLRHLQAVSAACRHGDDEVATSRNVLAAIAGQDDCMIPSTLGVIAQRIASPVIRKLLGFLGLGGPQGQNKDNDEIGLAALWPLVSALFDQDDQQSIEDISDGLGILAHDPQLQETLQALQKLQHPDLCEVCEIESPTSIAARAQQYRNRASAILDTGYISQVYEQPIDAIPQKTSHITRFSQDFKRLDLAFLAVPSLPRQSRSEQLLLEAYYDDVSTFELHESDPVQSPVDMVEIASPFLPVIRAQQWILNKLVMKFLFGHLNLDEHLSVYRQFYLLGNGLFAQRLGFKVLDSSTSSALFRRLETMTAGVSPDDNSMRRTADIAKLQRALAQIPQETYIGPLGTEHKTLPGNLTLAINLDTTATSVQDVTINDILRLQYSSPPALLSIFTDDVSTQYDAIFGFLLGLIHNVHLVNSTSVRLIARTASRSVLQDGQHPDDDRRASVGFVRTAHNVVSILASYAFDIAVSAPWDDLTAGVERITSALNKPSDPLSDPQTISGTRTVSADDDVDLAQCSPAVIANMHETTLLRIRRRLFLDQADVSTAHMRESPTTAARHDVSVQLGTISRLVRLGCGALLPPSLSETSLEEARDILRLTEQLDLAIDGLADALGRLVVAASTPTDKAEKADGDDGDDGRGPASVGDEAGEEDEVEAFSLLARRLRCRRPGFVVAVDDQTTSGGGAGVDHIEREDV